MPPYKKKDMEEEMTSEEERKAKDPDGMIAMVNSWYSKSKQDRSGYEKRWTDGLKMMKGIWNVDEKARSEVRGRSKIYFRKVWSTVWRLMASLYHTFLRDPDSMKLSGRMGNDDDVHKAGVLQVMVEYYRDTMYRTQDLFIQHVWAFYNILTCGMAVGLFSWEYRKGKKIDRPRFKVFPPEQVFPDFSADLENEMSFILFESYHTKGELKMMGDKNLDELEPVTPESSPLRSARHMNTNDPIQNPGENEFPEPGRYSEGEEKPADPNARIKVWQCFYRNADGKIMYCRIGNGTTMIREPEESKYGEQYPVVMGQCLTEPHKLFGEGWPDPLEGPQISLNDTINRRKDNVALNMNRHSIVSRYGNVDLASLQNSRAGAITLANDVNAVKDREMQDVTQSSYVEAGADEAMMMEMSGVTPAKMGLERAEKATVGMNNLTESNAKIDLFSAIVGETWMKRFYQKLAYLTQRFCTDEDLIRVANKTYRIRNQVDYHMLPTDVNEVDDFDADVIVDCGVGSISRENSIRETMLAMDRAVMANQSTISMLQVGIIPREEARIIDITKLFVENMLPKIGYKNYQDYYVRVIPPPPQPVKNPVDGGPNSKVAGVLAPQGAADVPPGLIPGGM